MTQDQLKQYIKYDCITGIFTRCGLHKQDRKSKIGTTIGSLEKTGYLVIRVCGNLYKAHRLAWLYMTGEWPSKEIDHINRIKTDNKWENLRVATDKDQQGNYNIRKDNKSGFRGVSFHKRDKVWQATLQTKSDQKFIGNFKTKEEARRAYDKAAREYFGEFYSG